MNGASPMGKLMIGNHLKSGQPKAQALQTAQRPLISKKDPNDADFNQPHHWASFILIGNGL
jgi:CHAT domain-containing protein